MALHHLRRRQFRHQLVQRDLRKVVAQPVRQNAQCRHRVGQLSQCGDACLGIRHIGADHRADPCQDANGVARTTGGLATIAQIGGEGDRLAHILLRGEHHLRRRRREIAPGIRRTRLEDHGMPLRRPRDVERTCDPVEITRVIQHMHRRRVDEHATGLVPNDGPVIPAIPQPLHDGEVFGRHGVAHILRRMPIATEIRRRIRAGPGDHVPPRAAAADMIQRRQSPGHIIRLRIGGGHGDRQADPAGAHRQRRDKGERFQPHHHAGMRIQPGIQRVGEEDEVQLAPLRHFRNAP